MRAINTLILFLCAALSLQAQTLQGVLKDAQTGETLPYVNIGVVGKNIGTVSDENGNFKLVVPTGHADDLLRISMLGYVARDFKVSEAESLLAKNKSIELAPDTIEMEQMVISNKKAKEKVLGNKTESKNTSVGFSDNILGHEIGMIMKIKKSPSQLKTFTASIASENNKPVKMRLNFYSIKNGLPDKLLINQNIIVTTPVNNDKLVVDLTPYNIMVQDDFFVGLEWIESAPGHGVMFSAGLLAKPLIVRATSQGTWEKIGVVGVGFTVNSIYWN